MAIQLSRRSLLKAGLLGTLALAGGGALYRALRPMETPKAFVLDEGAKTVLSAIIPVMLKDAIPPTPSATETTIAGVRNAIAGLPLATQKELQDLFGLLALAPGRRFLAGITDDWGNAKPEEVAAFLQSWRVSRFPLLQSAYLALHDLVAGAWYADESNWARIGYPGPLKELS